MASGGFIRAESRDGIATGDRVRWIGRLGREYRGEVREIRIREYRTTAWVRVDGAGSMEVEVGSLVVE